QYYAIPPDEGAFDPVRFERAEYSRGYQADRLNLLKILIRADIHAETGPGPLDPGLAASAVEYQPSIELVEEGYQGFNLVRYDRIYGLAQADGPFDIERVRAAGYQILFTGHTIGEDKAQIDRHSIELVEEGRGTTVADVKRQIDTPLRVRLR